jgi:hypothetical protein
MISQALPFPSPTRPVSTADRLVKLRDVESILAGHFRRESCPSRTTIIGWIEDGTLIGTQLGRGRNYYVYESSLQAFTDRLAAQIMSLAA